MGTDFCVPFDIWMTLEYLPHKHPNSLRFAQLLANSLQVIDNHITGAIIHLTYQLSSGLHKIRCAYLLLRQLITDKPLSHTDVEGIQGLVAKGYK